MDLSVICACLKETLFSIKETIIISQLLYLYSHEYD